MDLRNILDLLGDFLSDDKIALRSLPTLYDPNGDVTLTVRFVDVATREQFLADVAGTEDEAEPEAEPEPAAPKAATKTAAKKASKK